MFYPVDSLKRGGRFYLCWVADSWPLRFATITHRQLWSQDLRKICDDLLEVVKNESGRPTKRFSLRLSSQLMRGLVRLYQRKVTVFLGDLCMINANVSKYVNKKFVFHEAIVIEPRPEIPRIVIELPENEERVEDMIERSGNVVANVQDITLKEQTIPEYQPLLNDNFGEVHPEQVLQLLADRSLEQMMAHDGAAQHSAELPLDVSADKSHDQSRHHHAQMERISEHDLTMYRKSMGDELMPIDEIMKEIPEIPEIPEILLPELPVPQPEKQIIEQPQELPQDVPIEKTLPEPELVLEELEEIEPQAKRRRLRSKIIDKNIKLSSNYLRSRIDNNAVELRCEDSIDDVIRIHVPSDILLSRPVHAGPRVRSTLGFNLTTMFLRNLGVVSKRTLADREMEDVIARMAHNGRTHVRSTLEKIDEEVEPGLEQERPKQIMEVDINLEQDINISVPKDVDMTMARESLQDISVLPTQVLQTLSQARKRTSEYEVSPKRHNRSGYVAYKESRQTVADPILGDEANKENITDNISHDQPLRTERDLTSMLQEAGLADLSIQRQEQEQRQELAFSGKVPSPKEISQRRRQGSDGSETPLGSLDRTKVSLGDSDKTTDSMRFIRDRWGTEGTMIKILFCIKENTKPLDVKSLIAKGPLAPGYKSIITARCFTSILKLKQHGFIKINKDPETLEIRDISLGAKFEKVI